MFQCKQGVYNISLVIIISLTSLKQLETLHNIDTSVCASRILPLCFVYKQILAEKVFVIADILYKYFEAFSLGL